MKEATVEQNELQLRPCITVFHESGYLHIKNIGKNTAMNINVDVWEFDNFPVYEGFNTDKFHYTFEKVSYLEVGEDKTIKHTYDSKDDKTLKFLTALEEGLGFPFFIFLISFAFDIYYENIKNQLYYSTLSIDCKKEEIKLVESGKVKSKLRGEK
jgi:hypothetical protein